MIIGILGYGSIGKRHADNARRLGHDTMIYDPLICPTDQRSDLLSKANAIIIATPTIQHWIDILACCEAEKPMLIEKPLISPDQKVLKLVTNTLVTSGVPAFMGFNLRFHACVQKAKEWMPRIGKPSQARFHVLQRNSRYTDGIISNWMSHEIDLALWLLGPGKIVDCEVDRNDSDANITIKHQSGAISFIDGDYKTDPEICQFSMI